MHQSMEGFINGVVAQNILSIRKEKDLTQGDVAAILGVSYQQIGKYETGENRIPAVRLFILSQAMSIPIERFFDGVHINPFTDLQKQQNHRL